MNERERDEEHIRAVESDYDRAWAAFDVDALVDCMTDDATLVNPWGEMARGRSEIRTRLGALLQGPAAGSIHESRILRIEFAAPDVAIVDGAASISSLDQGDTSPLVHRFTDVLVRAGGTWRIAHVRAYFHHENPDAPALHDR